MPSLIISSKISIVFQMRTPYMFSILTEYRRHIVMFKKLFPCPICRQSCHLNKIYKYQVGKNNRPKSISMKMFKRAKFICSYAGCGVSYPLEKIHHHEMFECPHRSILCPAQCCRFINNVETVIIHYQLPFSFVILRIM